MCDILGLCKGLCNGFYFGVLKSANQLITKVLNHLITKAANNKGNNMINSKLILKLIVTTTVLIGYCITASASIINVDFGGADANDGSEITSQITITGFNNGSGVHWEDFDTSSGCGLTELAGNLTGSYSLTTEHTRGQAAPPSGDTTCYMVTPALYQPAPGDVTFDLSSYITGGSVGSEIDYLGFYWGSIDGNLKNRDSVTLYDQDDNILQTRFGESITGNEILAEFQGQSGNQFKDSSNVYINFYMPESSYFSHFLIASRGKAMEIDNVVFRTSVAVAEPFTLTLFSFAILGLAVVRQRSTSKLSTMAQY